MLQVTSKKFYSQFANGETFADNLSDTTQNLVGGVIERVIAEHDVTLSVISQSTSANGYVINTQTIMKTSGTWVLDGWNVGDTFNAKNDLTFSGTILTLNSGVMTYTLNSGTDTDGTYTDLRLELTSEYTAGVYEFGINENSDTSDVTINNVDLSEQMYSIGTIGSSFSNMNPSAGAKSWITGECQIKKTSLVNGECLFTIRNEIIILPYFLDSFAPNLLNGVNPDDYFVGQLSLKYIFNLDVRKLLSDPNISNKITYNTEQGAVGWFGENYNGGASNYTFTLSGYQDTATMDSVSGVQIDRKTTIMATIEDSTSSFDANTKIGAYVSAILNASQYQANNTLFKTLWNYDNVVKTNDTLYTGLSGIIKSFNSNRVSSSIIEVAFEVEFTTAQQALLTNGQSFLIALQTANSSLARNVSDSVISVLAVSTLTKNTDIPNLLTWNKQEHLNHIMQEIDNGFSNVRGWVEDGIFSRFNFGLDIELRARLQQLSFKLISKNTIGNEFTIQQYNFDLSSGILVPEDVYFKQNFNLDTTRGFQLVSGDIFNRVRLGEVFTALFVWGEDLSESPITTILYNGAQFADEDYTLIIQDFGGADLSTENLTKAISGFVANAGVADRNIIWTAIKNGQSLSSIRYGEVDLTAGLSQLVTFTDIGTTDYTIIPFDKDRVGMQFYGMNASKTSTTFEVTEVPNDGKLGYLIIENISFTNYRSGVSPVIGGSNNITFANFGTNDYTLFTFDVNYGNFNIVSRNKNQDSFDITVGIDSEINWIALINL